MAKSKRTIFNIDEFKPYKKTWDERQKELLRRRSYYDGSIYEKINDQLGWLKFRIGKEVKPLFLGLAQAVDVDAGIVPGGWVIGSEDLSESKIKNMEEAKKLLFVMSKWKTDGVLYVHYGAQYGIVGLKVSYNEAGKKVKVKPIDPLNFMLVTDGQDLTAMSIYIKYRATASGDEVEYAEVITPSEIRTFLDGNPWADDGENEWKNELAEVPYIEVRHIETGELLGEATFEKVMPLLDEVNEHATELSRLIEKHDEPQWLISGAEPSDLAHSGDNIWFMPEGAKAQILLPPVDIEGMLAFINSLREGIKTGLPEMAFEELRSKDQIASETLGLQLMELVLKVQRMRPNYDMGLEMALRMAGRASKLGGVPELAVLDDPELAIDEDREILPFDPKTRIEIEMMEIGLERMKAQPEGSRPFPDRKIDDEDPDEVDDA